MYFLMFWNVCFKQMKIGKYSHKTGKARITLQLPVSALKREEAVGINTKYAIQVNPTSNHRSLSLIVFMNF